MKQSHYTALSNVFANELEQALQPAGQPRFPFQSKAKVYRELAEQEYPYLRESSVTFGRGWSAVTVKGYELTEVGRLAFCMECRDEPEDVA